MLVNKVKMTVELRLIKRSGSWAGVTKFRDCHSYISAPISRSGNLLTGLSKDEAEELEKELGFSDGWLSPSSPFWDTFVIKVGEKPKMINCDYGMGKLEYLFLKNHYQVAKSLAEVTPRTLYVLVDGEAEAREQNRISKIRRDAYKEFGKMSLEDMRKCLRLYGMSPNNMSNDLVEAQLSDKVEQDPMAFFAKWVDNKHKDTEFLIEEALSQNILRRNKNVYYYGSDIVGSGKMDVVAFLDSSKNSDIKAVIQAEIQAKKQINN